MAAALLIQFARKRQRHASRLTADHPQRPSQGLASALTAALCIVLLLVCGIAQISHVHPHDGTASDAECSLCVVAHLDIIPVIVTIFASQQTSSERYVAVTPRLAHAAPLQSVHFIRPPPATTAFFVW